jgi:hypothetical protein
VKGANGGSIVLLLDAILFGAFGALYWIIPEQMAAKVGIVVTGRAGIIDLQGLYGGLEVGLAVFLLYCRAGRSPERLRLGLVAGSCALAAIALSRIVAIVHFGLPDAGVAGLVALDIVGAILNLAFLARVTRP